MKDPIDLSAIQAKITARAYGSAWEYLRDMDLMFENALSYNKAGSFHYKYAQSMKAWWIPRASATITEDLCKWRARVHERERESVCVCACVCAVLTYFNVSRWGWCFACNLSTFDSRAPLLLWPTAASCARGLSVSRGPLLCTGPSFCTV